MVTADSLDVDILESLLHEQGLTHIRVRRRADRLLACSVENGVTIKHARFTALPRQQWALEVADHRGTMQPTPLSGSLKELVSMLVEQFPWVLSSPA